MALLAAQCGIRAIWSRLLPRTSSLVLSQRVPDRGVAVRSAKFPEYSLIYDFEKIRTASRFNRMKFKTTVFTAAAVPASFALQHFTGLIAPDTVLTFTFFSAALTIFVHSCGILFNNVVGYIYLKDDDETVKISLVGYWGNRIDVDTKLDNIKAFSDESSRFNNPWYRRIRLNDTRKTYKLYHTAGSVLDEKVFTVIFGNVE